MPQIARLLGYGGLIPFAALAALALGSSQSAAWIHALIAYGAVILSFVGALHWAFGMLWRRAIALRARCFAGA